MHLYLGNFSSWHFEMVPRSFCADSTSPRISAIGLVILQGNITISANIFVILRKTSKTIAQANEKILACEIPYLYLSMDSMITFTKRCTIKPVYFFTDQSHAAQDIETSLKRLLSFTTESSLRRFF